MDEKIKQIFKEIDSASSIALCTKSIETYDEACAIASLMTYIQSVGKKKVELISLSAPVGKQNTILEKQTIPVHLEISPLSYVVSIYYGSTTIEKVTFDTDEKNGKINFYIFPSKGGFDFENVEYSQGGAKYDLTLTIGISDFKQMSHIYEKNEYLFKDNKTISLHRDQGSIGDLSFTIDEELSYSEFVFKLLSLQSSDLSLEVVNTLLAGTVNYHNVFEGPKRNTFWGNIASMVEKGADMNKVLEEVYYSKSVENLDAQIKLMHNVNVDKKARVVWSVVNKADLDFAGVKKETLEANGRIVFNMSSEFDIAMAAYEVEKQSLFVVIESNDPSKYSAAKIAGVFDGEGSDRRASFMINNTSASDFSKRFFPVLDDLYKLKVKGGAA